MRGGKAQAQARELRYQEAKHRAFEMCAEVSAGALVWYQGNPRVKLVPCEKKPGFKVFVHPKRVAICEIQPSYQKGTFYPSVSISDGLSDQMHAPDAYNALRMLTELIDCELGVLDDRKPS